MVEYGYPGKINGFNTHILPSPKTISNDIFKYYTIPLEFKDESATIFDTILNTYLDYRIEKHNKSLENYIEEFIDFYDFLIDVKGSNNQLELENDNFTPINLVEIIEDFSKK